MGDLRPDRISRDQRPAEIEAGDVADPVKKGQKRTLIETQFIAHLGGDTDWNKPDQYPNVPKETLVTGKFVSPHSACYDADGDIFVVEWINYGRITKLTRV